MKNVNHDLIQQLSEDLDSLWRYQDYLKNAKGCRSCVALWKQCKALDGEKVRILQNELHRHVKAGQFN